MVLVVLNTYTAPKYETKEKSGHTIY